MKTYTFTVPRENAGDRLGLFLSSNIPLKLSNKAIKRLIDAKQCRVNETVEKFASYKVKGNDKIELVTYDKPAVGSGQQNDKIKVLFEDDHLIIINKPIALTCLSSNFESRLGLSPLYLVHRLDRDTTGAIILAKTKKAKLGMENLFRKRDVNKLYHALCIGIFDQKVMDIENYLAPVCEYDGGKIFKSVPEEKGKFAKSIFKIKQTKGEYAFAHCKIITGVTHQIRVHAYENQMPVLGDFQYARNQKFHSFAKRPLLHAYQIEFIHPITSENITVTAPYAEDFKNAKETIFG
ncbi:MAG: Ribosomal large subunit pseudouridine synthase C [Chlamydiia bacterium]|nr:Ribosomal large subunit pseudouridine synthase C [Chlamydiia bacterium]